MTRCTVSTKENADQFVRLQNKKLKGLESVAYFSGLVWLSIDIKGNVPPLEGAPKLEWGSQMKDIRK